MASPTLNFNINHFGFLFTECLSDFSFNDIYLESNYLKYIWWFKNPTVLFLYNWRFHYIISRADITHSKYIKTFFTSFVELNKTWQSTKIFGNRPDQTVSFYSTTETPCKTLHDHSKLHCWFCVSFKLHLSVAWELHKRLFNTTGSSLIYPLWPNVTRWPLKSHKLTSGRHT